MQIAHHKRFNALVNVNTTIRDAIRLMGSSENNKYMAGISVIVGNDSRVIGVVSDGDVRRGLSQGISIEATVDKIANFKPFIVDRTLTKTRLRRTVIDEARRRNSNYFEYRKIILVEPDGRFYDVIHISEVFTAQVEEKTIAVYGLSFVGLTLAITFANVGASVIGVDLNKKLIEDLKNGIAPFFEKGLNSLILSVAKKNPIRYTHDPSEFQSDIHIVSVGTPVDDQGKPSLQSVITVSEIISHVLKKGDAVIFRSTLPVGTMRLIILPILERSGLKGGVDFSFAFAPERTVEGKALEELRSLPQIVGGLNKESTHQTSAIFNQFTKTIVEVESLEAAEMVKLINNTFRDVVFSFANEVAALCENYNINAFNLIQAANEGYPRDQIPLPSPGVGGICLSKDPYLYSNPIQAPVSSPILGISSRNVNKSIPNQILKKIESHADNTGQNICKLKTLIVGIAFKGMPETSDTRNSVALDLVEILPSKHLVQIKDFVVPNSNIEALGLKTASGKLEELLKEFEVILFMNNHYRNNQFNVVEALKSNVRPTLFFDGWNMFDQYEIESLDNVYYSTMGYLTRK